jgi:hypothetical protein
MTVAEPCVAAHFEGRVKARVIAEDSLVRRALKRKKAVGRNEVRTSDPHT